LDLDEPVEGWLAFFKARSVLVLDDPLGRPSISRWILGDLLREQRERETRLAEEAAAKVATLKDPVPVGIPAIDEDASAYESMLAGAGRMSPSEEFGRVPPPRFLEEALDDGARRQAAEAEAVRRRNERR
jgi:hypothetical protein